MSKAINYAYIGSDGMRLVVWAMGATEDETGVDLNQQDDPPGELALVKVSQRAAALLADGEIRCDNGDPLQIVDGSGQHACDRRGFSFERAMQLVTWEEIRGTTSAGGRQRMRTHKFQIGDRVKLTGKFLKATGQGRGHAGLDAWIVMGFWGSGDSMVQVNEPIAPDDPLYADLALEHRPKWRSIAAGNLFKVGTTDSRNCP